jgi:hypothetical protein
VPSRCKDTVHSYPLGKVLREAPSDSVAAWEPGDCGGHNQDEAEVTPLAAGGRCAFLLS